jgi:serine protease
VTGGSCASPSNGMVCLIPRGTYSFAEKAQACRNAGGAAAVIYNNATGLFYGTLGDAQPGIPVVSISQEDGQALAAIATKTSTVAVTATNYAYFDGTSMATPHVAGVAALIWSQKPECSNAAIRHALGATAENIGPDGRDVYTGYGLIRAGAALTHLDGENCGLPPPSTGKGGKK